LTKQLYLVQKPYESEVFLANNYQLYCDLTLLKAKTVHFNWPDIILADNTNKDAAFNDAAIPLTHNLQATNTEKQRKYKELAF
jgi:hypothetical protein